MSVQLIVVVVGLVACAQAQTKCGSPAIKPVSYSFGGVFLCSSAYLNVVECWMVKLHCRSSLSLNGSEDFYKRLRLNGSEDFYKRLRLNGNEDLYERLHLDGSEASLFPNTHVVYVVLVSFFPAQN